MQLIQPLHGVLRVLRHSALVGQALFQRRAARWRSRTICARRAAACAHGQWRRAGWQSSSSDSSRPAYKLRSAARNVGTFSRSPVSSVHTSGPSGCADGASDSIFIVKIVRRDALRARLRARRDAWRGCPGASTYSRGPPAQCWSATSGWSMRYFFALSRP